MIDQHCHLLPGIDDGPKTFEASLDLARMSADQGISVVACTPHVLAGFYETAGPAIRKAVTRMQAALDEAGIDLRLVVGCDLHIAPDNVSRLRSGQALALNDSRYVLLEMPHGLLPPRADHAVFDLMTAGYVPVLTHPERMGWIEREYDLVGKWAKAGIVMQITAGALTGGFGRRARYWSERMLDDGLVDLVATDAHDAIRRPPVQAEAYEIVCRRLGEQQAWRIFVGVPEAILSDATLPGVVAPEKQAPALKAASMWARARGFFQGAGDAQQVGHG